MRLPRLLFAVPFAYALTHFAVATPPPPPTTDAIRVIPADYVDTLQVPDRAHPQPVATVEADGQKIQVLSYFPELIVRQNGHIIVFGLLDDSGQISKIFTKEPKATMEVVTLGDKSRPCLIVRWEEAMQEGDGEAAYKFVQVWDVARRVCLANERWAAAAGPAGSTIAGKPPIGCTAEVSIKGGQLIIGEKICPAGATAQPRTAVRVDAPGAYALVDGQLRRR
jgi:hypothetical protein